MARITINVEALKDIVMLGDTFSARAKKDTSAGLLQFVAAPAGHLQVTAIGSENQVLIQRTDCEVHGGVFETLVPPKRLAQILATIREETIVLEIVKSGVKVKSASAQFNLATEAFDTFPAINAVVPDYTELSIPVTALHTSLDHCLPVCDEKSTRYALGGVLFDLGPSLTFVATDSRRMMVSPRPEVAFGGPPIKFVLPSAVGRSLLTLLKRSGLHADLKMQIQVSDKRIAFIGERFTMATAGVEGRFPRWQDITIGQNCDQVLAATSSDMRRAGKLVQVMTNEEHRGFKLSVKDEKISLSSGSELGDSAVEMRASAARDFETEIDTAYFIEAVSHWPDHEVIEWRQDESDSAVFFHLPDNMLCVLMPLARD